MNVKVNEFEKTVVIKLQGDKMLGLEANEFHEAVRTSIEKNKKNVVIDMSDVKYITSWGIGVLIYGHTTATNAECFFSLAGVPESVNEIFEKVKIRTIIKQYPTVEDALNNEKE